jgi:hypothetical protein
MLAIPYSKGSLHIINTQGQLVRKIEVGQVRAFQWSECGKYLALSGKTGKNEYASFVLVT